MLNLFRGDTVLAIYRVVLGQQSDRSERAPRQAYARRRTQDRYHLSLKISYPDAEDRARAAEAGVSPSGDIMIHGLPNGYGWLGESHRARDWTDGCVAVTNAEIEEIWPPVAVGTPVEIRP